MTTTGTANMEFDRPGNPRVVFGSGSEGRVADLLAQLGAQRVLLVATQSHRAGADRIAAALGSGPVRSVGVWTGAQPQVPRQVADALVEEIRRTDADWVLTHGGGTAIGAAKAAALEVDISIAAVPTTYAGSEMTSIWGISNDGEKQTGRDARVRPKLVVYDPDLYSALRPAIRRTSLFNALAHSVDALFDADAPTELHDEAQRSVREIVEGLRGLERDADDQTALELTVHGAHLAGKVLDGAKMALQHKLAHVLGGSLGTPHGPTHAALLPFTTAFNLEAVPQAQAQARLAAALSTDDPAAGLFDLAGELEITTRLSELEVGAEDIPRVVDLALAQQYANPRALTRSNLSSLLRRARLGRRPSQALRAHALDGTNDEPKGLHQAHEISAFGAELSQTRSVVIALHGRGSTAEAFIERVHPHVGPQIAILAPQAEDNSWWPGGFEKLALDHPHVRSAIASVDAAFSLACEHVAPERVVVVGFSQGACLVLSWLAARSRDEQPLPRQVVAWSGAAIPACTFGPALGCSVYLGIAERDPWVPLARVDETAHALTEAGATVERYTARSDQHHIRYFDTQALQRAARDTMQDDLRYQSGFGNALASEAIAGALPQHQNSPRLVPFGLYAEQINGTGFTVERAHNQRVWMYRLRPQIPKSGWTRVEGHRFTGDFSQGAISPEIMRHRPLPMPEGEVDFVEGMQTFAGAGDPATRTGFAIHIYGATGDMKRKAFTNVDADMLVVPQQGSLRVQTELGWLHVSPGEFLVLPRGIRFRVELPDGHARGYVGELFNGHYQLPERGPVGANGLADERHFLAPVAAFEDEAVDYEIVHRQGGELWSSQLGASPFDVVAWHGNYAPFKYDLMHFNSYWSVNFDHSDPSILTVLTSPHDAHGRNAVDFAVFRGRWDATEHTFRPPYFHRNSAIEFNAVVKAPRSEGPYPPGATTYTPYLSPHGIGVSNYERQLDLDPEQANEPRRLDDEELWIQFESTYPLRVMPWFADAEHRDLSYLDQFQGFEAASPPKD